MGAMTGIFGAARALVGLAAQEQADQLTAAENERDRLAAEVEMLRDKLAGMRQTLERERVEVRAVMAEHGARRGESLGVFVARLADCCADQAQELRRALAEVARCRQGWERAKAEEDGAVRRAEEAARNLNKANAALGLMDDLAADVGAVLRPVAPVVDDDVLAIAESVAAEVRRLRAEVQRQTVAEWEALATSSQPAAPTPEVCRTCAACTAGAGHGLPGAKGLCQDLRALDGGVVRASLYNLDVRPKACPGWRSA